MSMACNSGFIRGMGIGLVVGASIGMACMPKKKSKNMIGKALRVAGELADNITDAITG